jgi:PLP dependent protein
MNTIADSLQAILVKIREAKLAENRQDLVQLLAVSKAQPAERLVIAYNAGQKMFGENYVQEAISKQALLQDYNIEWHFIGPIQSNKTALIAQHFDWVQSVDRLKIAERLNAARPSNIAPLNVCIQINSSFEATKSGVNEAELLALAQAISQMPMLKLRGVMAIPAPAKDVATQRAQFKQVNAAFKNLQNHGFALDTLSIGMSDDYVAAIAEGATLVRIGAAIFGARAAKTTQD